MGEVTSSAAARLPFAYGWYSWDLGDYRPGFSTYDLYPYDELPPLAAPDPTFAYLRADDQSSDAAATPTSEASQKREAELRRSLDVLAGEAAALGMRLPEAFITFMRSRELRLPAFDWGPGCWFSLADHLVPCPGFAEGRLVGFLRDQQDCIVWCLCLLPGGEYRVLALGSDAVDTMPNAEGDALLGQFDPDEDYDKWDREELAHPVASLRHAPETVAEAIAGIVVCADTFEQFVYRFWLENEISLKLNAETIKAISWHSHPLPEHYSQPLTESERRYLDYYAHIYLQQRQPETSSG